MNSFEPSQILSAMGAATMGMMILWTLTLGFVFGIIGAVIGAPKDRKALGLFLGMTLGVFGWLFTLFAKHGDREEGIADAFRAFVFAVAINCTFAYWTWNLFLRPIAQRAVAEAQKEDARYEAEREQRAAEQRADDERAEAAEIERARLAAQNEFLDAPKFDRYGRAINRVPPPGLFEETSYVPEPAPAPRRAPPKPTPSPEQMRAEIERRYGAKK